MTDLENLYYKKKYLLYKKKYLFIQKAGNDWATYAAAAAIAGTALTVYGYNLWKQKQKEKQDLQDIEDEYTRVRYLKSYNNNCLTDPEESITIDDHKFILQYYKSLGYDRRDLVIIKSINQKNNKEQLFSAYRSVSDMGFWRLCINDGPSIRNIHLYKGNPKSLDYTQGTLLHLKLQKFINDNILKCKSDKNISNDVCLKSKYIIDNVDNDRMIEIEPFTSYAKIKENTINVDNKKSESLVGWTINGRLKELSVKLKSDDGFNTFKLNIDYPFNNTYIENGDKLDLNGTIINYVFKNGITLYAYKYELNVIGNESYNKVGLCPICMIPGNTTITEFGLYNNFISCGNYIGKLFDYSEQIMGDLDSTSKYEKFGKNYKYIGHHYENVYPYNETNIDEIFIK